MAVTIESLLRELSNDELKQAFDEITEWRNTGILIKEGIVRSIHKDFEEANNTQFPVHAIEVHFLYEISRRAYNLL